MYIVCIYYMHSWEVPGLNIIVSNSSDVPLYMQIEEQIKDAILKGELKDGELLPSIRNFANDVHVSVLTIRRVYDDLEREGFAVSRAGKGTFVSMGNPELLRDSQRRMVEQDLQKAVHSAKLYGIAKDEMLQMLDILYEEE